MPQVLVVPEGVESSDGRSFRPGLLTWRDTVPLMFTDETTVGHEGAIHVGNITGLRRVTVDGQTWIVGDLEWDSDEEAAEARRLAEEGKITGVSADVAVTIEETGELDDDGFPVFAETGAEIVGVTQLTMPAFADARILTDAETIPDSVTASVGRPPRDAFFVPEPDDDDPRYVIQRNGERAIPITFEGRRFYGHAHYRGGCHTGYDACMDPTSFDDDYEDFHVNEIQTDDGAVSVGPCLWRGDHAPVTLNTDEARDHYAHHAYQWGDARALNGRHGIWLSGYVRESVTDDELDILKQYGVSGDWRRGRMIAALTVNRSAAAVRRRSVAASAERLVMADHAIARIEDDMPVALVASGVVEPETQRSRDDLIVDALRLLADEVNGLRASLAPPDDLEELPAEDEVTETGPSSGALARVLDSR